MQPSITSPPRSTPAPPPRRGLRALVLVVCLGLVFTAAVVGVVAVLGLFDGRGPVIQRCEASLTDSATSSLAPDQADNAGLLAAIAIHRDLPARAVTIAIATAIQESKLRNIDYGDRDSLGLFQQRPSQGWGTPEQVLDPVYSTNAFYDVLVTIDGYESLEVTDAAQRVQRSAFPNAYADHEREGRAFASALTGHSPAALTCFLDAATPEERATATAAVTSRLARDFAGLGTTTTADGALEVRAADLGAGEEPRLGWAVAAWAVATADSTGVTHVATDGMVWDRADGGRAAWQTDDGPDAVAPGVVVIR